MATETFASGVAPSVLTEIETLKLDSLKSKVSAHNSQIAALQATQQTIELQKEKVGNELQRLYSIAKPLQDSFDAFVTATEASHTDLTFNKLSGAFEPKPVGVPKAVANTPETTSVQ